MLSYSILLTKKAHCLILKLNGIRRFIGISVLICVFPRISNAIEPIEIYSQSLINPVARQIRFNLTIENPTSQTLKDQTIWLYAPVKRTATQQLQKLDVSMPHQIEEDALGNQIVKLQFEQFPPFATKLVTIKADLLMSATPTSSLLKQTDIFLAAEKFIENDDPMIQAIALSIQKHEAAATAAEIYQWVRSNINYAGYIADDLGAKYAILNRRGDCTEYAYLATALARANHMAARSLGGYVINKNGAPRSDEYHNWAEVYVDGYWRLLDAQKENYQTNSEQYVAMRIISQKVFNPLDESHRYRIKGSITMRMN